MLCCVMPEGPYCQSCFMPMHRPEHFADGNPKNEYCALCMENGKFTEPNITVQEMTGRAAKFFSENWKMPAHQARMMAESTISKLKRWSQK
ncbi:MAG: transcriptional regulator [Peptococcaceae bacterium]|nr:MAG: transcriptional regulator [Peptococcaceae bacterium]